MILCVGIGVAVVVLNISDVEVLVADVSVVSMSSVELIIADVCVDVCVKLLSTVVIAVVANVAGDLIVGSTENISPLN